MKVPTLKKFLFVCLAAATAFVFPRSVGGEAGKKTDFIFGAHLESSGGISSSQYFDLSNVILRKASEAYGFTISIKRYGAQPDVVKGFINNEMDMARLWPEDIFEVQSKGGSLYPWATYTIDGRRKRAYCLWQTKDKNVKTPSDIIGKSFTSEVYTVLDFVKLRDMLLALGIDKPLWQVFSAFTRSPSQNSAYIAVAMGKADFYWDSDDSDLYLKIMLPSGADKLTHVYCTDRVYGRATIVLNKNNVSPQQYSIFVSAFREFMKNVDKILGSTSETQGLRVYFRMTKVGFAPAGPDEFSTEAALLRKAAARGWTAEAQYIIDSTRDAPLGQAVTVKPSYDMCKSLCKNDKNRVKCVENCMQQD